jgi:cyclic pyranopterin phosphate synthase
MPELSHIREDGTAAMVDVSEKPVVRREAWARGFIRLRPETVAAISDGEVPKGDVLATARIAAIQAAKRTAELIPLCHQLPLSKVAVDFELRTDGIEISAFAKTDAKTGVEMEALTAVSLAALTIYDMCKAIDPAMRIDQVELVEKRKAEPEWTDPPAENEINS